MAQSAPLILPGDNRASLAAMPENSIDAVVTDPPYSLTSITERFGKPDSAEVKVKEFYGKDGKNKRPSPYSRVSGGFMGKAWDATGIERDPEFWAAVYRVLKPGGFVFAFSGARTGHWQACAMEQAGFILHPMHAWIYGQGFPKGHDASKAIDKHLGAEGRKVAVGPEVVKFKPGATLNRDGGNWHRDADDETVYQPHEYAPGSPEAQAWDGWKYGTQTQKPAMEPIYLGQKPYDGKPVESILKWGVGAFNIDGCRVPGETRTNPPAGNKAGGAAYWLSVKGMPQDAEARTAEGRYPANVLHDGSPEVVALFPDSAGGAFPKSIVARNAIQYRSSEERGARNEMGDFGSAARFFNSFPADEFPWPLAFYHSKAGKADRAGSKHPTVKPIGLMRHLIRHVCPPGGTVLDPFAGSGTTAAAAAAEGMSCVLMEAEPEYLAFLRERFGVPGVSEIAEDIFA